MNQDETGITKLGCVNHDCGFCQPKREWVGLTIDDILQIEAFSITRRQAILMAIETLKEKNT
jgi:hypothetical protein